MKKAILSLIKNSPLGSYFNHLNNKVDGKLPAKIGQFRLVKKMGGSNKYLVGIYAKGNKKYLAKIWKREEKDFAYRMLKNELLASRFINKYQNKRLFNTVTIPEVVYSEEKKNFLVVLFEFKSGVTLEKVNSETRFQVTHMGIKMLEAVGKKFENESFVKRTGLSMAILYPFFVTKAVLTYPNLTTAILRSIPVFYRNCLGLISEKNLKFAHRDLHKYNFILNKKEINIVDFGLSAFTVASFDWINAMMHNLDDKRYVQLCLTNLKKQNQSEGYLRALGIYIATQLLTAKSQSESIDHKYSRWLKLCTDSYNEQFFVFEQIDKYKEINLGRYQRTHLFKRVIDFALSIIADKRNKNQIKKELPKKINGLTLVTPLQVSQNKPFLIGIYKNRRGEKFVAKIWQGYGASLHYYELLQDIVVGYVLNLVKKRISSKKEVELNLLPFHKAYSNNEYLIYLTKFVKGNHLRNNDPNFHRSYQHVRRSLTLLGSKLTPKEKKMIGEKSVYHYLFQFIVLWSIAFIRARGHKRELLHALSTLLKVSPSLFEKNQKVLIHGDIQPFNMIFNQKTKSVILFDFEQTVFSFKEIEIIATLSGRKIDTQLSENLFDQEVLAASNIDELKRISGLMILVSIQNIVGSDFQNAERYFTVLNKASGIVKKQNNYLKFMGSLG